MSKKVLVTGAAGFIGQHLVHELLRQGRSVRCWVRHDADFQKIKHMSVEIVRGDFCDEAIQLRAIEGVDVVFHLAAHLRPTRQWQRAEELKALFDETNAEATKRFAALCVGKIGLLVFFSSIAAIGFGKDITEKSFPALTSDYGKSKYLAERYLLDLYHQQGLPVRIVRPGSTYGPGNLAMGILLKFLKTGLFPSFGKGQNVHPFIFVNNLIKAVLLVEAKGRDGEVYFCVDDAVPLRSFAGALAKELHVRLGGFYIPRGFALFMVKLKEGMERALRCGWYPFRMDMGVLTVLSASSDWSCSNRKIKEELGYTPSVSLEEGCRLMVGWYKENRLL